MCPGVVAGHNPIYLSGFACVGQLSGFEQFHGQHVSTLVQLFHDPAEAFEQRGTLFLRAGIIALHERTEIFGTPVFLTP